MGMEEDDKERALHFDNRVEKKMIREKLLAEIDEENGEIKRRNDDIKEKNEKIRKENEEKEKEDDKKPLVPEEYDYKVHYVEHLAKYFMDLSAWKFNKLYRIWLCIVFGIITIVIAGCYYPTFKHFSASIHGNVNHWESPVCFTIYIGVCYFLMFYNFYNIVYSLYIKWSCLQYVVGVIPINDEAYHIKEKEMKKKKENKEKKEKKKKKKDKDKKVEKFFIDESGYNPFHYANVMDKKTLRGLQTLFKVFWENWKVEITVVHNSVFFLFLIWLFMAIWTLIYYERISTTETISKQYKKTFKQMS
jgi:hypothetical protein